MKKILIRSLLTIVLLVIVFSGYFITIRNFDNSTTNMKDFNTTIEASHLPTLLPSDFFDGQRFCIKMATRNGDTLSAFGDTGGGISLLLHPAIDKLSYHGLVKRALLKGVIPVKFVPFNDIITDEHIPPPIHLRSKILRRPFSRIKYPVFIIPPADDELKLFIKSIGTDIFLGQNFFMGKAWTIDYINQEVWVNTPVDPGQAEEPHVQTLGFKKNKHNENIFGHPSMSIEVNGQIIDVLFDTGASIILSENGQQYFNTKEKTIAGSFIAASVFDEWREQHPEWRYFEKVDKSQDVIEVPRVTICGYTVGPVLFAKRPDKAWSEHMIHTMDKVVKGAIGGSLLSYFRITIDYNSELVKFER